MNSSFPHLVKIGYSGDPASRAVVLQTSGVPTPFVVAYSVEVLDAPMVERLVHEKLANARPFASREFFEVSAKSAIDVLLDCSAEFLVGCDNGSEDDVDGAVGGIADASVANVVESPSYLDDIQLEFGVDVAVVVMKALVIVASGAGWRRVDLERALKNSLGEKYEHLVVKSVDLMLGHHMTIDEDHLTLSDAGVVAVRRVLGF